MDLSRKLLVTDLLLSLFPIVLVLALILLIAPENHIIGLEKHPQVRQVDPISGTDNFVWSDVGQRWLLLREQELNLSTESSNLDRIHRKCVWPEDECAGKDDRIIDQLLLRVQSDTQEVIKIFPPHAMNRRHFYQVADNGVQEEDLPDCPGPAEQARCRITYDLEQADVVIFPDADVVKLPRRRRRIDQIWVAYLLESPQNTFPERYQRLHRGQHEFNWTASFRRDSDLVTPYAKYVPFHSTDDHDERSQVHRSTNDGHVEHRELIRGKGKKVAWFASNCLTTNKRLEFARKLADYIQVDIYGKCGTLSCDKWNQTGCLEMLNKDYKFYLAFENSNSPDYITEKLFRNALGDNNQNHLVLPIVMGPPRSDYELQLPADSFIHVDDFGDGGGKQWVVS